MYFLVCRKTYQIIQRKRLPYDTCCYIIYTDTCVHQCRPNVNTIAQHICMFMWLEGVCCNWYLVMIIADTCCYIIYTDTCVHQCRPNVNTIAQHICMFMWLEGVCCNWYLVMIIAYDWSFAGLEVALRLVKVSYFVFQKYHNKEAF